MRLEGNEPIRLLSLARSNVVTWWQTAILVLDRPAAPAGISTTVGPRLACATEVDTGTTIAGHRSR